MNSAEGDVLEALTSKILVELINVLPKLMLAIIGVIVAFLVLRFGGRGIKRLLVIANLDDLINRYLGIRLPVSLNSIIMAIFYFGVILVMIYGLINLFLGEAYIELASSVILYGVRVASVVILGVVLFAIFSRMVDKLIAENRTRGFLFFLITLLLTAMLIDVTALSEPAKQALYAGLSMGIGAAFTIFLIWFFFHDYLEKMLERGKARRASNTRRNDVQYQ